MKVVEVSNRLLLRRKYVVIAQFVHYDRSLNEGSGGFSKVNKGKRVQYGCDIFGGICSFASKE